MNDTTPETQPKTNNNKLLMILAALAVLAIVAVGIYFSMKSDGTIEQTGSIVARVNGEEITQAEYDRSIAQISGVYATQGADPADPNVIASVKDQALTTLINRRLMADAAINSDVIVEDSEIEAEYQKVVTSLGSEEVLATALSENGMSEDNLRSEIRIDLLINKYLDTKLEINSITVTDEEIEAAYNTALNESGGTAEVPALADVRDLISGQLLNEKQQLAINTELERLRQEASIEILI